MEKSTASAALTSPTNGTSFYKGSSVTHPQSTLVSELSGHHTSFCDSASSTIGSTGVYGGANLPASPFAWDMDGAHTHALVSPVMLSGKKKNGILFGLKKIFNHHTKAEARAATGQGQRGVNPPVTSSDGTTGQLDPSISAKTDRSIKSPTNALRMLASYSRDLSLAALITSPVRGSPVGVPGSPTVLNSPMPSMRLDTISSTNLNLNLPDSEASCSNASTPTTPGEQQQRLFSTFSRNGRHAGANQCGQVLYSSTTQLTTSLSAQLSMSKASLGPSALQSGLPPQTQQQTLHQQIQSGSVQHPAMLLKRYSGALPGSTSVASSGNLSVLLPRGDSMDDNHSNGSGTSNRVALPSISSLRNQQHEGSNHGGSYHGGSCHGGSYHGGNAAFACGGRAGGPMPPVVPEMDAEVNCAEEEDEGTVEEEEKDQPGTVLLGTNPAVPPAMRRRRWSLEDYQVDKRMYKGATSAVYRATCMRSGIKVALKVYFLNKVPVNVVHMIRREIELHVPLVHRNIIMLYAAFQDEKHIVLVEEFAARGDLFGIHRSMNCRLTETQTSELILAPFLDALAYLHGRGIMHRDIKPENILFTSEWTLKIADFGVSINVHAERAVTRTGTADYMAPEVERCPLKHAPEDNKNNPHLAYTPAIDIWSAGVLAYEMMVGFPPFVSNNNGEDSGSVGGRPGVAAFLAEQATRKTLRFPASVSAAAKDFIMATLNENPADRPTAQQLLKHPWLFKLARRLSTTTSRLSNTNLVAVQY